MSGRRNFIPLVLLIAGLSAILRCALAEDAPTRTPVPDPAAQTSAQTAVHDLFKADFAAKLPAVRLALAAKLLKAAGETLNEPASAYVLLRDARDIGVSMGNPEIALAAADELATRFDVDRRALLVETMTAMDHHVQSPESAAAVMIAALTAIEKAAAVDDQDTIAKLSPIASAAASQSHSAAVAARVQARLRELKDMHTQFQRVEASRQVLASMPDDVEANTVVGKYMCVQQRDWPGAMPFLAKGQDGPLKTLAVGDVDAGSAVAGGPKAEDAKAALARADAWWQYASTQSDPMKEAIHRRALTWYQRAVDASVGLQRVKMQKRVDQVNAEIAGGGAAHKADPSGDAVLAQARRDVIEKSQSLPLEAKPITATMTFPASLIPYQLKGTINVTGNTAVNVLPGTEIRGGTFYFGGGSHLSAVAEKDKPIIFRHVTFIQDLNAALGGDGAVFDDCQFNKGGAWYSVYSSKWQFNHCLLHNCRFGGLTEMDYGFQIVNSVLVSMDFPEITHPHNAGFSHVGALHQEWNKISGSTFVDCTVPPTVAWCAEGSNFVGCRFVPGEAFESDKPWQQTMYLIDTVGAAPQAVWLADKPKHAPVTLMTAPTPYPIMPLAGLNFIIPELVPLGDGGVSVTRRHFKTDPSKAR